MISWKSFGKFMATLAKVSAQTALAASNHPEVIETVASIAGHPEVAAAVAQFAPVVAAVQASVQH